MITLANDDGVKNMLIVFNTNNLSKYLPIIENIIQTRFDQLRGLISLLIVANDINDVTRDIFDVVNTLFCF